MRKITFGCSLSVHVIITTAAPTDQGAFGFRPIDKIAMNAKRTNRVRKSFLHDHLHDKKIAAEAGHVSWPDTESW